MAMGGIVQSLRGRGGDGNGNGGTPLPAQSPAPKPDPLAELAKVTRTPTETDLK
jgi:hypothetical protein